MCTVTFLPLQKGFILTSNRDEWTLREKAIPPQKYVISGREVFFPKDQKAGGTWIVASATFTLCLLNGAFEKHTPKPPYKKSRGLMVLDFFEYNSVDDFTKQYDFLGIENFTLVIVDHSKDLYLTELRWDGSWLHVSPMAIDQTHIWSSATLYTDETIAERKGWFGEWINSHEVYKQPEIIGFHRFGGKGDISNDILMNRDDKVKTVSITSIIRTPEENHINYFDTQSDEHYEVSIFAGEQKVDSH